MDGFEAETYGERVADTYDDSHDWNEAAPAVARLAELARGGPALELAIGTGRVALPLAATGIRVDGIDISPAMVAKLRAKPGGDAIAVTMGDFADVGVAGRYPLVYLVFNTLFALLTQDDQVRCFANVAEHLADGGVFVIEAFVPDLARYVNHQAVTTRQPKVDRIFVDTSWLDPSTQRIDSTHAYLTDAGVRLYPLALR